MRVCGAAYVTVTLAWSISLRLIHSGGKSHSAWRTVSIRAPTTDSRWEYPVLSDPEWGQTLCSSLRRKRVCVSETIETNAKASFMQFHIRWSLAFMTFLCVTAAIYVPASTPFKALLEMDHTGAKGYRPPFFLALGRRAGSTNFELVNLVQFTNRNAAIKAPPEHTEREGFSLEIENVWSHDEAKGLNFVLPVEDLTSLDAQVESLYTSARSMRRDPDLNFHSLGVEVKQYDSGLQEVRLTIRARDSVGRFDYEVNGNTITPLAARYQHINLTAFILFGCCLAGGAVAFALITLLRRFCPETTRPMAI